MLAHASRPSITMLRVAILASDDKNPNSFTILSIDYGIGEILKYMNSPHVVRWCPQAWELDQQIHYAMELVKEPACKLYATFLPIEARSFEEIKFSSPV